MTRDLVQFVRDRLDEDEKIARDAERSPERITGIPRSYAAAPIAIHIARHDPARVLADIEAKRRIVNGIAETDPDGAYITGVFTAGDILRLLALPYADHPDYDEEWRP